MKLEFRQNDYALQFARMKGGDKEFLSPKNFDSKRYNDPISRNKRDFVTINARKLDKETGAVREGKHDIVQLKSHRQGRWRSWTRIETRDVDRVTRVITILASVIIANLGANEMAVP